MKAIPIDVYREKLKDCTNGGISSRYNTLLLPHKRGFIDIDENNPPENLIKIGTIKLYNMEYKCIEPYAKPEHLGWMDGGNIGYSCDSRFREISEYPLMIHDRQETQEQYDKHNN